MPSKNIRVRLEPQSSFGKIHEKPAFVTYFWNNLPKNCENLLDDGGARPCSTPGGVRNVPGEKNGLLLTKNPSSLLGPLGQIL